MKSIKIIKKIYHGLVFCFIMLLYYCSFPLAFILYGRKKFWLISEVDFDARDNGYHFFKYLSLNHKEINSIYLISKKNESWPLIKKYGKTVEPHSYRHLLVFIAAKVKLSTLVHGCSPSGYLTKYLIKHHGTGINVALKHGIFKNIHPNYFKNNAHLDLICCGAKPEFDFIDACFGYEHGVARYTGLARFDELNDFILKKQVLIMPTWRRWLDGVDNVETFKQSDFFKYWFGLLTNKKFLSLLNQEGLEIIFYIHPKLNKFVSLFKNSNSNIKFLFSKNGDSVQEVLKTSTILITDYSSVFFDFAYMKKPCVFFQFDEERYYSSHYQKAYFDYRENGFGDVCTNINDFLTSFEKIIRNSSNIEQTYFERATSFFELKDNRNCYRIFVAIKDIL